jgi:hypothetical protein
MDGYSPERSGSDLLMQSAGLLIICHMREETTDQPTNFLPDGFVEDRFIGRIHMTHSIVRTAKAPVKSAPSRGRRVQRMAQRYWSETSPTVALANLCAHVLQAF